MILMSGKELAAAIKSDISLRIKENKLRLTLAVILIGHDAASEKYVSIKKQACEKVGIGFQLWRFTEENSQKDVLKLIQKLNRDKKVTGIIVQLPLPSDFIPNDLLEAIDPKKDVDGLNSVNLGRLVKGLSGLFPATPEGVINLLKYYQVPIVGKKVAVIGQSNLVGRPLAQMLLNDEATVLSANKFTENLREITLEADIVISAVGKHGLVKADMVKDGVIVIDIGTSMYRGKIAGDVDFRNVSKKASYITPSPGGVGPMTVAMLLSNVVKASQL
jgi:methylenetetrahydrofolate dehydrogenase (NADP+) / methenyltetrahydrofolate cyclohydrolase